jgi:hypothetical protein
MHVRHAWRVTRRRICGCCASMHQIGGPGGSAWAAASSTAPRQIRKRRAAASSTAPRQIRSAGQRRAARRPVRSEAQGGGEQHGTPSEAQAAIAGSQHAASRITAPAASSLQGHPHGMTKGRERRLLRRAMDPEPGVRSRASSGSGPQLLGTTPQLRLAGLAGGGSGSVAKSDANETEPKRRGAALNAPARSGWGRI